MTDHEHEHEDSWADKVVNLVAKKVVSSVWKGRPPTPQAIHSQMQTEMQAQQLKLYAAAQGVAKAASKAAKKRGGK